MSTIIEIRPANSADADAASGVILRALREVNGRDYPKSVIDAIAGNFTPAAVLERIARHIVP